MVTKIIDFLNKNWFFLLILFVLIYIIVRMQVTQNKHEEEVKVFEKKIEHLKTEHYKSVKIIDSLKNIDTIYVKEIKIIKGESYETIKLVDTMSVSDMQKFFANRYSKEE